MIRASFYAPAKITSSLLYSALIFSIGFDFLFFNKTPNSISWMGIFLVILSSVLTVWGALSQKDKVQED
jgi:drug/metabolite transporter (DMT)-like permease